MNPELKELHDWLESSCPNYISMITVGSYATGDTLIEGRSDNDICLIFNDDFKEYIPKIKEYVLELDFDEEYIISTFEKQDFIGPNGISHDFSHKFRSKVLFGDDFTEEIKLPDRDKIFEIYSNGLKKVKERLKQRLNYGGLWRESKVQKEFWQLFKHTFMHLSIKHYYETGIYPKTRDELVSLLDSPILNKTLITLKNINHKNSEEIFNVAYELSDYI
ncbi:nucleotidyltransferase domain-containing protein [Candidatus Woesearchaeota archaeon]|nr:nucleotidyltransferase domain-containing protein [Candidatus Woesearchaeota archaeon]